jgi:hypothetical protein
MGGRSMLMLSVALAAFAACGDSGSAGGGFIVRDSAGVSIAENAGDGEWGGRETWHVSKAPLVDIGVLEGAPEYQLFQVRSALRLADGRIVVANASELRFFDADGTYLRTAGQQGSGPGEFEGVGLLKHYPGDSLLAYDFQLTRASVFDNNGEFGRSYRVIPPTEGGFGFAVDVFADGTLIIKSPQLFQGGFSEGLQRRDEDHYTIATTGGFLDSVGTFPGPEQFIETARDGDNFMVSVTQPPFGRTTVLAAHGRQFCVGWSDVYEIQCHGADGTLERIIRRDLPNASVTSSALERYREQELADQEDDNARRDAQRRFSEMPVAETMPAYDDLQIDAAGHVWIRAYAWDDEAERRWAVFDPAGRLLGDVLLPPNFGVTQIGTDFVLGVWRDDLEVEHVRLYELIRE